MLLLPLYLWSESDRASAWILCNPQNFNPYVASTIDEGGANVDLSKITNYSAIITPDYDVSGDLSAPVKFWIVNDTNYVIPQGKRVRIACSTTNDEVVSDDFKGLMKITFLGYASTSTGVLDTTNKLPLKLLVIREVKILFWIRLVNFM